MEKSTVVVRRDCLSRPIENLFISLQDLVDRADLPDLEKWQALDAIRSIWSVLLSRDKRCDHLESERDDAVEEKDQMEEELEELRNRVDDQDTDIQQLKAEVKYHTDEIKWRNELIDELGYKFREMEHRHGSYYA